MTKLALPILIVLSLFTFGCSRLDFAVRFADFYLMHEADRLFDLNSKQEKDLKPEVQQILTDIRRNDFPKIADLLENVETQLRTKGLTPAAEDEWFAGGERIFREVLDRVQPSALRVARESSPAQEANFAKEMKKDSENALDEVATPAKEKKANRKRVLKWTDDLMGSLTSAQDKDLDQFASEHPFPVRLQVKNKDQLLDQFLKVPREKREAWIKKLFAEPEALWLPEYKKARTDWQSAMKGYGKKLWESLGNEQKQALFAGLKRKAGDFRRLSKVE